VSTNIDKCRKALTDKSPITLFDAIRITKLDGWDSAEALNRLVSIGEAIRTSDKGATVWGLKDRPAGIDQTEPVIGRQSHLTIVGRA
jgi:hypothetical protein